jgi:hypothetical protein
MVNRAVHTVKRDICTDFDDEQGLRTRDYYILYNLTKINNFTLQYRGVFS